MSGASCLPLLSFDDQQNFKSFSCFFQNIKAAACHGPIQNNPVGQIAHSVQQFLGARRIFDLARVFGPLKQSRNNAAEQRGFALIERKDLISQVNPIIFLRHFDARSDNVLHEYFHRFDGLLGQIGNGKNVQQIVVGYEVVKRKNSEINSSLDLKW